MKCPESVVILLVNFQALCQPVLRDVSYSLFIALGHLEFFFHLGPDLRETLISAIGKQFLLCGRGLDQPILQGLQPLDFPLLNSLYCVGVFPKHLLALQSPKLHDLGLGFFVVSGQLQFFLHLLLDESQLAVSLKD